MTDVGILPAILAVCSTLVSTGKPVVAVMPFENHAGDPALAPLGRGLADMLLTDLSALPSVVVVERGRLGAVLEEMKLQQGAYFDAATTARVGRGLGATHVVTGSILEVTRVLRMDARVVEVETGVVTAAASASGAREAFLELHARLVAGLAERLSGRPAVPARATRAGSVEVALAYGAALEHADAGRWEDARAGLEALTRKAPLFGLARDRREEIAKRIKAAKSRGVDARREAVTALVKAAEAAAAIPLEALDEQAFRERVAWRHARFHLRLRELRGHFSPGMPALLVEKDRARVEALLAAAWEDVDAFAVDRREYGMRFTRTHPGGHATLDTRFALPESSRVHATLAGIPSYQEPGMLKHARATFFLSGWAPAEVESFRFIAAPLPGVLVPALLSRAETDMRALVAEADAGAGTVHGASHAAVNLRMELADAYVVLGRDEDAAAVLQEAVEKHPGSPRFEYAERKLRELAGLSHNASLQDLRGYQAALATCEEMPIRKGVGEALRRAQATRGVMAWADVEADIGRACTDAKRRTLVAHVHGVIARSMAEHGMCAEAEKQLDAFVAAGGSAADAAGYRRMAQDGCARALAAE